MTHGSDGSDSSRHRYLFDAYKETCYVIDAPAKEIQLRVGQHNAEADGLLNEQGVTNAAFITAWNPGSVSLSTTENNQRQQALEKQLQSVGFRFMRGRGRGTDPTHTPEESVFVIGIPRELAVALSNQFGQLAFVWHEVGRATILVSLSDGKPEECT